MTLEISCLCSAVRVRISAEPTVAFYCHCTDCRAAHGGAYVGVALYPSSAVEVAAGAPRIFTIRELPRAFCPACGTRLFARVPGSEVTGVVATCLPEGAFAPAFHVNCAEALAPVRDDLPHFLGQPSVFGGDDRLADW